MGFEEIEGVNLVGKLRSKISVKLVSLSSAMIFRIIRMPQVGSFNAWLGSVCVD